MKDSVLPHQDLKVDFGKPEPGSANPMPDNRREEYEKRIRSSLQRPGIRGNLRFPDRLR